MSVAENIVYCWLMTDHVSVWSDSYLGVDLMEDIKLDVQEAREARIDHPQWDFEADEDEEDGKDESEESEYATNDDFDED